MPARKKTTPPIPEYEQEGWSTCTLEWPPTRSAYSNSIRTNVHEVVYLPGVCAFVHKENERFRWGYYDHATRTWNVVIPSAIVPELRRHVERLVSGSAYTPDETNEDK